MCGRRVSEPQSVLGDGRCGRGALELCFGIVRGIVWHGLLWCGIAGCGAGMVGVLDWGIRRAPPNFPFAKPRLNLRPLLGQA